MAYWRVVQKSFGFFCCFFLQWVNVVYKCEEILLSTASKFCFFYESCPTGEKLHQIASANTQEKLC